MSGNTGDKATILKDIANNDIIAYDENRGVFINKRNKAIVEQWRANHEYEEGELFLFDEMMWVARANHISSDSSTPELDEINGLCYPIATEIGYANIIDFSYEILNEGTSIKLDWTNPESDSYEGRNIYTSNSIDITEFNHQEIEQMILDGEDIQLLTTGLGTNVGVGDTYTLEETDTRKYYYFKGFVKHTNPENLETVYSTGRYISVRNADIYPPLPPVLLTTELIDGGCNLKWTQPTDDDFFYTKIVRSRVAMPTLPTEGTVIDTVSGSVGRYRDSTIQVGHKYYYKLFSFDDAGNGMQNGLEGNYSSDISAESEIEWIATLGYDISTGERLEDAVGMRQSDFTYQYPYSDIARCVVDSSNGDVLYYLDDEDSTLQEDGITIATLDGTDGQVVTEIPEFYYSMTNNQFKVSKQEFDNSVKFDRTYIGVSEASEDVEGAKLQSAVGMTPIRHKSLSEMRSLAGNIGDGWQLADYKVRDVIKALFLIEFGEGNSQKLIGEGIVDELESVKTGDTVTLGNKIGVSANGSVSYRGIENLWGNIDEFVEGVVLNDTSYYLADSDYNSFVDDESTGSYESTGVAPITSDGYISDMYIGDNLVGIETLGNTIDFVGDHQYSHKKGEINILAQGGNYQDGDKAGLFRNHMGLNPFGKESEMTLLKEYDKSYKYTQYPTVETKEFTFESTMSFTDGDGLHNGFYYKSSIDVLLSDEMINSITSISIDEV